jgi:hypothetical protein
VTWESPAVWAELERIRVTYAKAGAADFIWALDLGDDVTLLGTPREHPRRSWRGSEACLLDVLHPLPADAGVEAVWQALDLEA